MKKGNEVKFKMPIEIQITDEYGLTKLMQKYDEDITITIKITEYRDPKYP